MHQLVVAMRTRNENPGPPCSVIPVGSDYKKLTSDSTAWFSMKLRFDWSLFGEKRLSFIKDFVLKFCFLPTNQRYCIWSGRWWGKGIFFMWGHLSLSLSLSLSPPQTKSPMLFPVPVICKAAPSPRKVSRSHNIFVSPCKGGPGGVSASLSPLAKTYVIQKSPPSVSIFTCYRIHLYSSTWVHRVVGWGTGVGVVRYNWVSSLQSCAVLWSVVYV